MKQLLLILLIKSQNHFNNQHLSLLNVKNKKDYVAQIFLKKQNTLYWSLCQTEISLNQIPVHCWSLEKQWSKKYKKGQKTNKSIFVLLNQLCTKNVTKLIKRKDFLAIKTKMSSKKCQQMIKLRLKTISYRNHETYFL